MKVNNEKFIEMTEYLDFKLKLYRKQKNFNAKRYIKTKIDFINKYFQENNLSKCVVGVSGGIDSAVVLGLLKEASKQENSPITQITPVLLPSFTKGTTNQEEATKNGVIVSEHFGLNPLTYDVTKVFKVISKDISKIMDKKPDDWEYGQLIPNIRVPVLNFISTLQGSSIIIGTTNKSEGAYIGYFGKYSDAMVDIQPITDLYKNEVYKVAKELKIPKEIRKIPPRGDIYNDKTDEEMFGCTYDFLELIYTYKSFDETKQKNFFEALPIKDKKVFKRAIKNLENFHQYNAHKYKTGSQAIHLDISKQGIKDGWQYNNYNG